MIDFKQEQVGKIVENVSLAKYTTYRLKGKARYLITPSNIDQLKYLLWLCQKESIPHLVIGGGSNLIFADEYYDGVLISLKFLKEKHWHEQEVTVGAAYSLIALANECMKKGFSGLEFAGGIPGTVGGAIYNNSGAYLSDMKAVIKSAVILTPDFEIKTFLNEDLHFTYRNSFLKQKKGYVCLEATFSLEKGDPLEIQEKMEKRRQRRMHDQPLSEASAGSVFRNPPSLFAGKLIEEAGLKGYKIGDAMVSLKHANFIINVGEATGADIIALIEYVRKVVYEKTGIELILEQQIIR